MLFMLTDPTMMGNYSVPGAFAGAIAALVVGMFVFFLIASLAIWIYSSFAFMAIARKAKQSSPGIAWIPIIGPLIVAFRTSKMHWWPWLLIIGFFIPFINWIAILAFFVFAIIWFWKMFERVGRPGWWALLYIIPIVGPIIFLILVGVAAWGKN